MLTVYLHHLLALDESVGANSSGEVVESLGDAQLLNGGLVQLAPGKQDLVDDSGGVTYGAAAWEQPVAQVGAHGEEDGQQGPLGDGGGRILEISRQIGAGNDSSDGREEDGKDAKEAVHLAGFVVVGVLRIEVLLE